MSFEDDEPIVILNDGSSGKEASTFPAGKIQIEVIKLMEAPLEETSFKVLLKLKESGDIEGRHGLDLVMVIDISGSMHEGGKLDKLKIAVQFVVEKLSPIDRFSVVTFFDSSNRLFPLRQITEDSKAEIIHEIRLLKAKNSEKNIAEGLKMALKVLNDRFVKDGRVGAIMLFSDGAENRGKATEVDVSKVPVHTFGFGASHDDQSVLSEIAYKSDGGTFSNVQNENRLHVAFSNCLDELLTVVVKDLRLIVAQVNKESIIKNVVAGNYNTHRTKKSKFTIYYGYLYGKEVREVLVDLVLPNIVESGPRDAAHVLLITYSYSTKYAKKRSKARHIVIDVKRTGLKEIRPEDEIDQKDEEKIRRMKEKEEIQLPKREKIWENQPSTSNISVDWVIKNEQRLQHALKTERCNSNDLEEPESSVPQEERKKVKKVSQSVKEIMLHSRQHFKLQQLSIGPIHAAKSSLFKAKLKIKLAEHFIKISGRTKDILLRGIKEKAEEIKIYFHKDASMFYAVEDHYYDDELILLVYFDGCAILGFIDAYVNQKLNMFDISPGEAASIQEDLFLLDNQIPFIVLESLMGVQTESGNKDLVLDFCRFIALMVKNLGEFTKFLVLDSVHKHPLHILDLLREVQLLDNPNCFHQNECMPTYLILLPFSLLCYCACGAVVFISWIWKRFNKPESLPQYSRAPFLNVQELKNAGIEFEPSDSLKSISFRSSFVTTSQLKLPRLVVDHLTVKMLSNLAAYEMCLSESHRNQEPWLISYMKLLDSLVDDENDVKDLKAADILQTGHISDADVANLINGMGSKLLPPHLDTYEHVKKEIVKHCGSRNRRRCALWIAQVYNTHFRSPWTILALFAAIAVLVLTFVQTWYAVNPKIERMEQSVEYTLPERCASSA